MEPLPKRLRILQSVEVDESNSEYVAAKKQAEAQLKRKFESIFSKFGAMPEAMSDEIDMRTGEIVVDRGHYRKLDREYQRRHGRRGTELLDTLILGDTIEASEDEESDQDSRDELAPSQSPEPRKRKQIPGTPDGVAQQPTSTALQPHSLLQANNQENVSLPNTPESIAIQTNERHRVPNPGNSPLDLRQFVQFPETPAGQQAQSAFIAQISQAIQEAVTPIVSNMLAKQLSLRLPNATTLPTAGIPVLPDNRPVPSTATNPVSPAISEAATQSITCPSPVPVSTQLPPSRNPSFATPRREITPDKSAPQSAIVSAVTICPLIPEPTQAEYCRDEVETTDSDLTQVEAESKMPRKRFRTDNKYHFASNDEEFITEQRLVQKTPWKEIKKRNPRWKDWPVQALQQHWRLRLRSRAHNVPTVNASASPRFDMGSEQDHIVSCSRSERLHALASRSEKPHSENGSLQLPTPNSLEHESSEETYRYTDALLPSNIDSVVASGAHFDDDEKDLLSLTDADEVISPAEIVTEDELMDAGETVYTASHVPEDSVVPSVEIDIFSDPGVKDVQDGLILTLPSTGSEIANYAKLERSSTPILIPPISSMKETIPRRKPLNVELDSEPDDELNLLQSESPQSRRSRHGRPRKPCNSLRKSAPSSPSTTVTEDELLLSPTPVPIIKREPSTPPHNLLFSENALHTPLSAPQTSKQPSSAATATSRLSQSAFRRKVKQTWAASARKSTPVPKLVNKRSSLHTLLPRKRAWQAHEDSEDELAL